MIEKLLCKANQSYRSLFFLESPHHTLSFTLLLLISFNIYFQFCCRLLTISSTPSGLNLSLMSTSHILSNRNNLPICLSTLIYADCICPLCLTCRAHPYGCFLTFHHHHQTVAPPSVIKLMVHGHRNASLSLLLSCL